MPMPKTLTALSLTAALWLPAIAAAEVEAYVIDTEGAQLVFQAGLHQRRAEQGKQLKSGLQLSAIVDPNRILLRCQKPLSPSRCEITLFGNDPATRRRGLSRTSSTRLRV